MQHRSSVTVSGHLEEGYEITQEWSNSETGDNNISVCELEQDGKPTLVYVCDNSSATLSDYDFDGAIEAVEEMEEEAKRKQEQREDEAENY